MAILLNDNLDIAAPKAADNRFGPHVSVAAANTAIPSIKRFVGLTVGIISGSTVVEYWYRAGITDGDLVVKSLSTNAGTSGQVLQLDGTNQPVWGDIDGGTY